MPRLIAVTDMEALPAEITLEKGDVLSFTASGGHVKLNTDVVELLGPFVPGVLGTNGGIIAPQGAPGIVLFYAQQPGKTTIDIVTGDPFYNPVTIDIAITVL